MSGNSNYPTGLDDDTSLFDVIDDVTPIEAAHHNNLKEGVKALEAKLGIYSTSVPTSVDFRLGHPTDGHRHDGASGQGQRINPTAVLVPSGGIPSGLSLWDHLVNGAIHGGADGLGQRHIIPFYYGPANLGVATGLGPQIVIGRDLQIESITATLENAPAGGTTILDVNMGATSLFYASQGLRPMMGPSSYFSSASTNTMTYASGQRITVDCDQIAPTPGSDLTITFIFRE